MTNNQSHISTFTLDEVLDAVQNPALRPDLRERIEKSNPAADDLRGVKAFLEEHDYDFDKINDFVGEGRAFIKKKKSSKKKLSYLGAAAAFIVIIGITSIYLLMRPSQGERLFAKFYIEEPGLPVTLTNNMKSNHKLLNESMNLYKDEQYEKALHGFDALIETDENNDTINFYTAIVHFELGRYEKAQQLFDATFDDNEFQQKALYYSALIDLKQERFQSCKTKLKVLKKEKTSIFSDKADRLLKQLPIR